LANGNGGKTKEANKAITIEGYVWELPSESFLVLHVVDFDQEALICP